MQPQNCEVTVETTVSLEQRMGVENSGIRKLDVRGESICKYLFN